jgi:LacI family transcriptional regulator
LEAAGTLGYQMQIRTAVSSRHNLSVIGTVGKIEPDIPTSVNAFYSYVLSGIEQECQRNNLSLMYANIAVDKFNRISSMPPMFVDNHVDGVLMVGTFIHDTIRQIGQKVNKPVVLVDGYAPGSGFDSVVTDNINGAFSAVSYLIEMGHTCIGLAGSVPNGYPSIRERRKGYLRALSHHGILQTFIEDSPLSREGGYNATCRLLQNSPEITAIFASNDEVAVGAINAAREMGRNVPDDLSIIGFDDIDLAQQITPALTTVHVDKMLMGSLAVRHLLDRSDNPNRAALTTLVSTHIVVRQTVRALR